MSSPWILASKGMAAEVRRKVAGAYATVIVGSSSSSSSSSSIYCDCWWW